MLAPLVLAALLSIGTTTVATAANTNCVVTANVADCPDVPSDGISYVDHPTVNTVNTLNGNAGPATVTSGTIGINLKKTGVDSTYTGTEVAYQVITYDIDAGSGTDNRKVLAKGGVPVLVGTDYIFSQNAGDTEFKIGTGTTVYTNATLAEYLQGIGIGGVAAVSGSLTVNNSVGGVGTSFSTTNADGIHVESLGGRGGNGGCTTILIASWCDNGGSGGDAGSVAVNNDGTIVVNGTGYGVSATSTGGAGGNGGGMFGLFGSSAGTGGTGGNGAKVTVNLGSNSNITTWGNGGHGVYAVSNGGDGGGGGTASGAVALGSKGGQGGAAGEVEVDNAGTITTHGTKAYGIFAQSMGAGAGSGSSAGGIVAIGGSGGKASVGNKVTVGNTGTIETWGADSFGILAQSIGGGGGDGGSSGGLFAVGGRGNAGGPSDIVKVYNSGTIITHAVGATGILAQSVGGGGGNGGNAYSGGVTISVAVGGNGGLGGAGGKVAINQLGIGQTVADLAAGSITTSGDRAHGIQAQSVGGGGGNGGLAVAVAVDPLFAASVAMGGKGDNGGNGDTVVVNEKGKITTGGNQSHGIFAQSVGGGGGNGGGSVAASASGG